MASAGWRSNLLSAGIVLGARVGGAGLSILCLALLARGLEAQDLGGLLMVQAAGTLGAVFLTLNADGAAVRFLSGRTEADPHLLARFTFALRGTAAKMVIPVMIVSIAFILVASPTLPTGAALALLALIPAAALLRTSDRLGRALGHVRRFSAITLVARAVVYLVALAALFFTGSLSIWSALGALILAYGLSGIAALVLLRQVSRPGASAAPSPDEERTWRAGGLALMTTVLLADEYPMLVALLGGLLLPASGVAGLLVALRLVLIVKMAPTALTMAFAPAFGAAWNAGQKAQASRIARRLTGFAAIGVSGAVFLLWIGADLALGLFGAEYTQNANALRLLLLMPLTTALLGPSLLILTSAGENRAIVSGTLLGIGGLFVLVPAGVLLVGGVTGGALGLVAANLVWEGALFVKVRQRTGVAASVADLRPAPIFPEPR